jgi:hypothetical protein
MSLHAAAQHLAKKGRGQDKMLVHMSPNEVKGLQAIAHAKGGSLSVNPNTGLVEAGFLEDALPFVAAAAATYFTAGAAAPILATELGIGATASGILAGAGAGALISGGMAAIQGKNWGQAALMGGLGGALAGGMGGFEGAPDPFSAGPVEVPGTPPTGTELTAATKEVTTTAPSSAGISGEISTPQIPEAPATAMPSTPTGATPPTGPTAPPSGAYPDLVEVPSEPLKFQNPSEAPSGWSEGASPAGTPGAPSTGAPGSNIPKPGLPTEALQKQAEQKTMSTGQKLALGATGLMGLSALSQRNKYGIPNTSTYESNLARISPNFRAQEPVRPNPYYRAQYPTYAADGGLMAVKLNTGGEPKKKKKQEYTTESKIASMPAYEASIARLGNEMRQSQGPITVSKGLQPTMSLGELNLAKGGEAHLGDYSDGGRLLKGPGDGVSDSIPATIGKKQPARLADGEFVVPARIVSELGNGSTDAGARKLYGMMDRIQKKRRAAKGIATDTKAEKLLPA